MNEQREGTRKRTQDLFCGRVGEFFCTHGIRLQAVWRWVCESGLNNKTWVKDRDEKHKI